MNTFKRALVPALVAVVLLAALVYRLSSCSPDKSRSAAETPVNTPAGSPGAESPPSPAVKPPAPPYSGAEIRRIYESLGLSVLEIRDAGEATMVRYYKPTGVPGEIVSRFDWFDRKTGAREFAYGPAYTDRFEIGPDKSLTVLTTGKSPADDALSFPVIYRAGYTTVDGAVRFSGAEAKYYAPLDYGCTVGLDRRASLADINVNPGFVSFGFSPQPGFESEFYAANTPLPKTDVAFADGLAAIRFYKTLPSGDSEIPAVKENSYCSFVSLATDGADTIVTLRLGGNVSRYNVSTEYSPATGLPYAVIEFTAAAYDYPAGW